MRKNFTDRTLQTLSYGEKTETYWDTNLPAFGFRVGKIRKTFIVSVGKERKVITIGHYPDSTLRDARTKAKAVLAQVSGSAPKAPQNSILAFLDDAAKRLKPATVSQYRQYLEALEIDLEDLGRETIKEKLKKYDGKPWAQNYAYATVRVYLNWCLENEYIDKHPLVHGRAPNKTKSRARVLSDEELARVWRCAGDSDYGYILKLLVLTAQRRMEVRNLKPEDVTDVLTFHTKGDKINILPITPMIREHLRVPFKFNNWGDAKRRFDEECGVDFRHHDLRRTAATRLASMQVSPIVVERLLGHALGGVAGTYNRYTYLKELEEALLTWESHILTLTTATG